MRPSALHGDAATRRSDLLLDTCTGLALLAVCGAVQASSLGGSAGLTTDYVWRGTSQTQGDPAVQAGASIASDSGLYASAWGSNVEFPGSGASTEFDVAVGWSGAIAGDWAMDVNVLHYRYPSTEVDLDWTELNGRLTYAGRYWAAFGWSPEALGAEGDGLYSQAGVRWPVGETLALELAAGRYALYDAYDDSYWHGQASAIWTFKVPFELRVTAHATDSSAERLFGESAAGNRIEAALQASF
ncbi:TorF family putative porin [Luteimonas sp. RD2P54]|uniref:TorF family putative porin n=1 Tax=Luteimonas endophytica TaxID=3042023 RepID=A0ABT6J549_9GAMM|nr:TorF family putative porin [Luteimonas endophytica]MDH5821677.1 TorF family putative porin [Luteimonas endophytica]